MYVSQVKNPGLSRVSILYAEHIRQVFQIYIRIKIIISNLGKILQISTSNLKLHVLALDESV